MTLKLKLAPISADSRFVALGLRRNQTVELWSGSTFLGRVFVSDHEGRTYRVTFEAAAIVQVRVGPRPDAADEEQARRRRFRARQRTAYRRAGYRMPPGAMPSKGKGVAS